MSEIQNDKYRALLQELEQKAQESYDKAVLTLSGGAFALSLAFTRVVVGPDPSNYGWLFLAWASWGASIAFALFSHYMSARALREAIVKYDAGDTPSPSRAVGFLNGLAGVLFLVGTASFAWFVWLNLESA